MTGAREHPLRHALTNELHARPFERLAPPERASHFAFLAGEDGAGDARAHLLGICARYGVPHPPEDATHFSANIGNLRLKWERHTEFVTYTLFRPGPFAAPFLDPPASLMPEGWLTDAPGELLVAVHIAVLAPDQAAPTTDDLNNSFVAESLCSSLVAGGAAQVWADFRIHEDGFSHILVRDGGLLPRQAGRLVQRLLEIETYRTMALLALPIARETGPRITRTDKALADLTARMDRLDNLEDERRLLDRLTALSSELEAISASTAYRFSAAVAYSALIDSRVNELREDRTEGYQTIREFLDRRFVPSMRTCESVADRKEVLSNRASRAGNLLRTRVDIALEGQNRDLLASMDRRARLQLRLQQTVEGLSVVAITYYLVSLVGYVLRSAKAANVPIDVDVGRALAVPVVALLVWLVLRQVRRALTAADKAKTTESKK